MRGTLEQTRTSISSYRIIPAHAGNSQSYGAKTRAAPDHPRACGELQDHFATLRACHGSSPRMRGTPPRKASLIGLLRIIPAHAGNSQQEPSAKEEITDHPRACGELGSNT